MEKENEKSEEKEIESKQEEIIENKEEEKKQETEILQEVEENIKEEKKENDENNEEEVNEAKEEIEEDAHVEKKKTKKLFIILPVLIIVLLFLSTIFAITNINNEKVIDGVYIEQVAIYGMSKEEINNLVGEKLSTISEVSISYGDYNDVVKIEDLGIEIDAKEAIQKAIHLGKTNNIVIDNYQILFTSLFKEHIDLNININEDKFNEMVNNIQVEMPEAVKEYSYEIKDDELIITNGKAGKVIESKELKERIIENIKEKFNGNEENVEIPTKDAEPSKIDIEKIYNEIHKEAKDAYIVEEPFELHKEENGIDLKITMEEAKIILEEEKETYSIPLKITKPKVKVKDLGDKLFKQTLSKYTTIYDAGNTNRASNIALAAKTINGTILLPGETFSYNGTLGNTTKEKGYKEGGAYVGGKVVQAYGGGICQVSTTLYNAALYANLEIVERYNHSYSVSYVPAGRDATVSYGGKDFKFKNTRKYPIKIVANAKNGVVSISIAGIKEEKEYEIVLTSSVLSTTPYSTTYEKNSSLAEGKQKVIQKGHSGQKSIAYKVVKYNGKTISKTVLSKDTYKPMNRIVQVGTKKTTTNPVQTTPTVPVDTQPAQTTNSTSTAQNNTSINNNTNV